MAAAAAARKKNLSDSSSSSGDEEALQRLREAAWQPSVGVSTKMSLPSAEPSLRGTVSLHKDDGNELQTTAEFQAHVAKKLGAILDSSITTWEHPSGPVQNDAEDLETEEDGFRLFSSSVPGNSREPKSSPSSARRRWRERSHSSSSSDQDWQRCREAAVTAADILKHSGFPGGDQDAREDDVGRISELGKQKKRKKKKKKVRKNGVEEGAAEMSRKDLSGDCMKEENGATEDMLRRKKRKKARENGVEDGGTEMTRKGLGAVHGREENGATADASRRKKRREKRKKLGARVV